MPTKPAARCRPSDDPPRRAPPAQPGPRNPPPRSPTSPRASPPRCSSSSSPPCLLGEGGRRRRPVPQRQPLSRSTCRLACSLARSLAPGIPKARDRDLGRPRPGLSRSHEPQLRPVRQDRVPHGEGELPGQGEPSPGPGDNARSRLVQCPERGSSSRRGGQSRSRECEVLGVCGDWPPFILESWRSEAWPMDTATAGGE